MHACICFSYPYLPHHYTSIFTAPRHMSKQGYCCGVRVHVRVRYSTVMCSCAVRAPQYMQPAVTSRPFNMRAPCVHLEHMQHCLHGALQSHPSHHTCSLAQVVSCEATCSCGQDCAMLQTFAPCVRYSGINEQSSTRRSAVVRHAAFCAHWQYR